MRRAEELAVTEHATVEAAGHAQHLTPGRSGTRTPLPWRPTPRVPPGSVSPVPRGAARRRAKVEAACGAVKAVRAELELRARRPADQRAREEEVRAQAQTEKRAAKQVAADKRAARQQRQQNQGRNRGGGVR
ncbi:hypothetical protein [Streptacidiphilus carbonis]|uniref:hypothetical protein n=1 Tax=Streptacidiphilus carbonis TaxID=105422 RepID=UPI0005A99BC9|nr:hypothetical protein [Streptacidiphilus carbonis]